MCAGCITVDIRSDFRSTLVEDQFGYIIVINTFKRVGLSLIEIITCRFSNAFVYWIVIVNGCSRVFDGVVELFPTSLNSYRSAVVLETDHCSFSVEFGSHWA